MSEHQPALPNESSDVVRVVGRRCETYAKYEHPGDGKYLSIIAAMLDEGNRFGQDWFDCMLIDKLRLKIIDAEIMVADDPTDIFLNERLLFLRTMEADIRQADSLCARNGS